MAALHATLLNGKGNTVSATSREYIETMAETWDVRIETTLWKDGRYTVRITDRDTGVILHQLGGQYPASAPGRALEPGGESKGEQERDEEAICAKEN